MRHITRSVAAGSGGSPGGLNAIQRVARLFAADQAKPAHHPGVVTDFLELSHIFHLPHNSFLQPQGQSETCDS